MSLDLVLHLMPDDKVSWSVINRETRGRVRSGQVKADAPLSIPAFEGVDRTLCLLPSEFIFTTRLDVPARNEREALQAAPFLLEDELASDLESTLITLGRKGEDGRVACAVDKDRVAAWFQRLAPALVRPIYTLPDCLALAPEGAALSLFNRNGAVVFLYGHDVVQPGKPWGGAADQRLFDQILSALVHGLDDQRIAVSRALGLAGPHVDTLTDMPLDMRASAIDDSDLDALPGLFGAGLTARFQWRSVLRPLRRTALMAASILAMAGLLMTAEMIYFNWQADRYDTASVAHFDAAFGDEVGAQITPVTARRILDRRLADAGLGQASSSFLDLMAGLDQLTEGMDQIRVDHVRFDRERLELSVSAIYDEFSDFDALSERAGQLGLGLDDQGSRETDQGIEGDFVLRLP